MDNGATLPSRHGCGESVCCGIRDSERLTERFARAIAFSCLSVATASRNLV